MGITYVTLDNVLHLMVAAMKVAFKGEVSIYF